MDVSLTVLAIAVLCGCVYVLWDARGSAQIEDDDCCCAEEGAWRHD